MNFYGRVPSHAQKFLRRYLVTPGKRLLSRGVIHQDGFVVAKQLDQSIPFLLWREACYEPALSALFRQVLCSGDTFFDIGANIGYFTLLGASSVGPGGHVHSFEPNPGVFDELKRNVALNRFTQVTHNNVAVSDCAGNVQLYFAPEMDSGLASMRQTSELLTQMQTVRAITLDEYVAQHAVGKIRAMKLDVEGAELMVLQGAQNLLASTDKPDLIALEAVRSHAKAFETTPDAVAHFLMAKGYRVRALIGEDATHFRLADLDLSDGVPDSTLIATVEGLF